MQRMTKIYQVFVSSTYTDLGEERLKVLNNMLANNYFPLGMEYFPASSETQFNFCKRLIDITDYYVLILGTRYGTTTDNGLSYTEMEYNYAESKGIPILAFINAVPDDKPHDYYQGEELERKFNKFKERAAANRVVNFWRTAEELAGQVINSLHAEVVSNPRLGLIRADTAIDIPHLSDGLRVLGEENNRLKRTNQELEDKALILETENAKLKEKDRVSTETISNLKHEIVTIKNAEEMRLKQKESLEFQIDLSGQYIEVKHSCLFNKKFTYKVKLEDLFKMWGPYLYVSDTIYRAKGRLEKVVFDMFNIPSPQISMESFNQLKITLLGCELIELESRQAGLWPTEYVALTQLGRQHLQAYAINDEL